MTTHNDPDDIRRDIERTRAHLSQDVNALADEAKPGNVVRRQVEGVKEGAQNLKERVFGSPDEDVYGYPHQSGPSALDRAQQFGDDARQTVQDAPRQLKRRARGNPLAAGLIAFGAGALLGSLIPTSQREQQLASDLKDRAQPAVDAVQAAAKDAAEHLKPEAQQAAQSVKESATQSAQFVADEGRVQAQDVRDHAATSAQDVRSHGKDAVQEVRDESQKSPGTTGRDPIGTDPELVDPMPGDPVAIDPEGRPTRPGITDQGEWPTGSEPTR
ncbi:DUF3618 domain-containing protein [Granulicoccus sp. GXG6511]|uniref:DUF3618 domain-containing protein n=1 Tax=Granulicoccus sp. GXG6511 TaxID=3381351 RepID=UPI003D7E5E6E